MMEGSVLLFFIDGLGIGKRTSSNPLDVIPGLEPLDIFEGESNPIIHDGILAITDACLGVEGRPQSASGQTTILTGVNAPQLLGHHKQGFPNQALRDVIKEKSIFRQLTERRVGNVTFANAYTPKFFTEPQRWKSATTCAVEATDGMGFRTLDDLRNEAAVFHDFTNSVLRARGVDIDLWDGQKAGEVLAGLVRAHRFTLYEYFITDKVGHEQDMQLAKLILPGLSAMIRHVLEHLDLSQTTVILTSDHGNIEDLSIRNHTLNNVPTIVWGKYSAEIAANISSLTDITPAVMKALS